MISPDTVIKKNTQLLESDMQDEMVMMSMENNAYFGLNKVGKEIWLMLEEPTTISNIIDRLTQRYNVSREQCLNDITPFIENLLSESIVSVETISE